jgi:anti-sigma-K factor RskA
MAADPHSLVAPYALDALDPPDEQHFEQHLAHCERCRRELAGLREAASSLAYGTSAVAPPPALKDRILEQARSERPNVVSLPELSRRRNWTTPLAAVAAIAASVAIGLGIWTAVRPTARDPFAAVLSRPGARLVPLGARGAVAVAPDGDAVLALAVSPAPSGKAYETWVIRDGNARPAGLFAGREGTSVVELERPVPAGSVVAVTLERAGGAEQPTSKPLAQTQAVS